MMFSRLLLLSIRKLKNISITWYSYILCCINLQFQSLVFHFQDIEKLNLPPVVLLKHLIFNRLKYLHKSTNTLPIWKTFSHFSSAMRSFVRQVHCIDRDLLCGSLIKRSWLTKSMQCSEVSTDPYGLFTDPPPLSFWQWLYNQL